MKKLLTLVLLATLFASCSSDDDDNEGYSQSEIIGTWHYESSAITAIVVNNKAVEEIIREDLTKNIDEDYSSNDYLTFKENREIIVHEEKNNSKDIIEYIAKYAVKGNALTFTIYNEGEIIGGWSNKINISGNKLTIEEDLTEDYQKKLLENSLPDVDMSKIKISKIIAEHTYKKK